jgi:lipopolysaccharide heptosyltransferase II
MVQTPLNGPLPVHSADAHVMVLRFSSAGDVLLTAPALQALKAHWPRCRITFVTRTAFAPLVRGQPHIDTVVAVPRQLSLPAVYRLLAAQAPQKILDLHGSLRSRLLCLLLRPQRSVRWHKRDLTQTLGQRLGGARAVGKQQMVARYHAAAQRLAGAELSPQPLRFQVPDAAQAQADAHLQAQGIDLSRPLVGISPGAQWATKRWPVAYFAEVIRWLQARCVQVLLTGSAEERPLHREVMQLAPQARSLAGCGDLAVLAGLLARCTAVVANDSGPMHLARALQVPTVAIFGSTDPKQFDFTGHAVLYSGLDCAPCSFYGRAACPLGHLKCLTSIEPGQVTDVLARWLGCGTSKSVQLPASAHIRQSSGSSGAWQRTARAPGSPRC